MAVQKITASNPSRTRTETTPLLIDESRAESQDDASSETLTGSQGRDPRDEEGWEDDDKANQPVGRGRGVLIILSLSCLMFLQGM